MNLQQIFDRSVTHMLTQGHQSSDGKNCKYRSDAGACAIGGLFPDSAYRPEFDDRDGVGGVGGVGALLAESRHFRAALQGAGIDTSDIKTINLLEDLQQVHDSTSNEYFMVDIKNGAQFIAEEFGLTYES